MAGVELEVKVSASQLESIQRKLDPRKLVWPIAKDALDQLGAEGARQARSSAMGFAQTGRMAESIDHKVNAIPVPLWVVVRASAKARTNGLLYPALLEVSTKHGRKNWLLDAIRKAERSTTGRVASMIVSGIEKAFGGS